MTPIVLPARAAINTPKVSNVEEAAELVSSEPAALADIPLIDLPGGWDTHCPAFRMKIMVGDGSTAMIFFLRADRCRA
jgi:hypothetical protein